MHMYKKRSFLLDMVELRQIVKTKFIHLAVGRTSVTSVSVGLIDVLDFSVKVCLLNSIVLTSSGLTENDPVHVC